MIIANILKMLSIIDFSKISFKEVLSLSDEVETFLIQNSQQDRNVQQQFERPDVVNVKQKILKDRTKFNENSKNNNNDFPSIGDNSFEYLGLIIDKSS